MLDLRAISTPVRQSPLIVYGDSIIAGSGATSGNTALCSKLSQAFTPDRLVVNAGIGGQNITQMVDRFLARPRSQDYWPVILNGGRIETGDTGSAFISDVDRFAAAMPHDRFLIALPMNGDYANDYAAWSGGSAGDQYDDRIAARDHIIATYPDNYVDPLQELIDNADGSAQDLEDVDKEIVPDSLRVDNIHLTDTGQNLIANLFYDAIVAKGW